MLTITAFRKGWDDMMRARECWPWTFFFFYKWRCKYGKIYVEREGPAWKKCAWKMMRCHIFALSQLPLNCKQTFEHMRQ